MSMTKRLIETEELSERLVEKYQDRGLSEDVTRLLLCALPYQTSMHTTPFVPEDTDHPSGQASVLLELERAIKVVAHQYSSDVTLEDEIVERRMIEPLLEDMNVLSYGARYLHEEPTFADHEQRLTPLFGTDNNQSGTLFDEVNPFVGYLGRNASFRFWREWYQGFLDGKPLDWELQRRVALIDNDIWEAGPEAVAEEITRIEADYEAEQASRAAPDPDPVTEGEKSAIAQRATMNRDALAVTIASLLEQLADFKERVRGLNHLEPEFRQELLDFIDGFSSKLTELLTDLPDPGEGISDAQAGRLALWLRDYKGFVHGKLAQYASPQNVAEATVPTAIVLAGTGVGAMLGMPVAGVVAAGLIANTMKPGQAAKELTKPSKSDGDVS